MRIVMLHGWLMSPAIWTEARRSLSDSWQVIAPSQPGHGTEPALAENSMARWREWLVSKTGKDRPLILVGHSLGGMLALSMLRHRPELVAGVVVVASTATAWSVEQRAGWQAMLGAASPGWAPEMAQALAGVLYGARYLNAHPQAIARWHESWLTQQDLRAAADIVTRELRRIGTMQNAISAVATPGAAAAPNPFSTVTITSAGPAADIEFSYHRRGAEIGPWRFVLQNGVIRTRSVGSSTLQDLTDGNVMRVTRFEVNETASTPVRVPCPRLCPDGSVDCWPEVRVREYEVILEAEARNDSRVRRTLRSVVRPRNDLVTFQAGGSPAQACPA